MDCWQRITVVLVTRNSEGNLPTSLGSLAQAQRIIVVDALSTDRTIEIAKAAHPAVEIVHIAEDRGWGAATNIGFKMAETEFVLNINPDTYFHENCIERLVALADANPNAAIVAPVLTNARGNVDLAVMGPGERHHREIEVAPAGPFCTWFVTGAVVLWRTEIFRAVGGFDENIFLYSEDADICLRATRMGYSLIVDPEARSDHFGGHSEDVSLKSRVRRDKFRAWGHLYFERKHGSDAEAEREAKRMFRRSLGEALMGLVTLRPKKLVTNLAKASVARAFLKGGQPWGRS
jgi:GT2 family glycosyltransferase